MDLTEKIVRTAYLTYTNYAEFPYSRSAMREAIQSALSDLRAQQPAPGKAVSPFMYAYEEVDQPGTWRTFRQQIKRADGSICPGLPLYTHPAPSQQPADDKLREAVEAIGKAVVVRAFCASDPLSYRLEFSSEEDRLAAANAIDQALSTAPGEAGE